MDKVFALTDNHVVQPFDDPNANFVRALTYRSADVVRMTDIYKNITDLKKEAAKKEAERKEMEDIVEQDKLVEIKGRRPFRLGDVFARPQMDGKRLPGELEIHHNGLRYHSTIRSDNRIGKNDYTPRHFGNALHSHTNF